MAEIKKIEVGKFYFIHDGSETGHPGLVVWKDDEANLYLAIKVGTSKNKANRKLTNSLYEDVSSHYVYSRPFLGKRKDLSYNKFLNIKISNELISKCNQIKLKMPVESTSINRKDRRNFKRLFRQK